MMDNDGIANAAQIACKCDRWPERLLQQRCLHDRCHRCDANSAEASAVNSNIGAGNCCKNAPICTACDDKIQWSADDTMFHLGGAIVPRTLEGQLGCECCLDKATGAPQRTAAYLCEDCLISLLCYECKQYHDKFCGDTHCVLPIDDSDSHWLMEHRWARIPPVLCRLHESKCELWCYSCDAAKCHVCAMQCGARLHSICSSEDLDLHGWTAKLRHSTSEIEEACRNFKHVEVDLELEHRADMLELKRRKMLILNAVDSAFAATHANLESNFRDTCQWITNLRSYVDSTVRCSRLLTRHPLPSHGGLIKFAQRAVERHMHAAQSLMARKQGVLARLGSSELAEDLEDVIKGWIGSPSVPAVPEANALTLTTFFAAKLRPNPQSPCYDIAATLYGHVLVAAGTSGLQERDLRGLLLDTWLPAQASPDTVDSIHLPDGDSSDIEAVVSVDCLEDDRAVVGLKNARAVVLLKREVADGRSEWIEKRRFHLGHSVPVAVAARDNLLIVALGSVSNTFQELLPGRQLTAFGVNTGIQQASVHLDFEIDSATVSAGNAVIVASHDRLDVNQASKRLFVIESRSSDLQSCLWRVLRDEPILGLAASASGALIYASVARERGRLLLTFDADCGLISKDSLGNTCTGVQKCTACFFSLGMSITNESRHRVDEDAADCASTCPGSVDEVCFNDGHGKKLGNQITAISAFGKLSCSKSETSNLVALGFKSKTMLPLTADVEQPLLQDSKRRALYLTIEFLTVIVSLGLVLLLTFMDTETIISGYLLFVSRLQKDGIDINRLSEVVLNVATANFFLPTSLCRGSKISSQVFICLKPNMLSHSHPFPLTFASVVSAYATWLDC